MKDSDSNFEDCKLSKVQSKKFSAFLVSGRGGGIITSNETSNRLLE